MTATDAVTPEGRWRFNDEVTACFDDMLQRSIPQYDVMRQTVFDVACKFVKPQTAIVDLGCSRGEALAPFVDRFGENNRYVGVEVSAPMLEASRKRFEGAVARNAVSIREMDLRREFPLERASVILSVLTIQFTPIEYRQQIVHSAFEQLVPGGAMIMVEKVLGATHQIDRLMVDLYLRMKGEHGYSNEAVARKRASLEGVLVPVTAGWNEELLLQSGFRCVDCFWRWMNFAAWLAIKGD
ncbi:methyltransferase domain-containing protein [Candidatus Sumerlaeota bacterium]|nr:methyltransferase domain-containing protein [Candidatus Sumerlaeota bacterium]